MKKVSKIFGLSALALATLTAGVFGLSGCGNKVKMAEIRNYVASEEVSNVMSAGYKVEMSLDGMSVDGLATNNIAIKGVVDFREDEKMEAALEIGIPGENPFDNSNCQEQYLRGDYLYSRTGKVGKYTRQQVDWQALDTNMQDMVGEYTNLSDVTSILNQYLDIFAELEGQGLKITKTNKNGVLQYKLSYKDPTGRMSFVLAYKDNQISKLKLDISASYMEKTASIYMNFELFEGEIEFPEDLDTNFEEEEGDPALSSPSALVA